MTFLHRCPTNSRLARQLDNCKTRFQFFNDASQQLTSAHDRTLHQLALTDFRIRLRDRTEASAFFSWAVVLAFPSEAEVFRGDKPEKRTQADQRSFEWP